MASNICVLFKVPDRRSAVVLLAVCHLLVYLGYVHVNANASLPCLGLCASQQLIGCVEYRPYAEPHANAAICSVMELIV